MIHRKQGSKIMIIGLFIAAAASVGCGSKTNMADTDAKMRAAYDHKAYSKSDIPENQRAIVEGFMNAGQKGQVPAAPPAKPK